MPVSLTLRDLPDETRDELAARAARAGRSLEEYVRALLVALANRPAPEDLWDRVQRRVRAAGTRLPVADVLDLRETDRR